MMVRSGKELLRICEEENISLSEYAIRVEMEDKGLSSQKGRDATMVFEVDHEVTSEIIGNVKSIEGINKVIRINPIKDGE